MTSLEQNTPETVENEQPSSVVKTPSPNTKKGNNQLHYSPGITTSNKFDVLTTSIQPVVPSAPPLDTLDVSVGNNPPLDHNKRLLDYLNDLKTTYFHISSKLCSLCGQTSLSSISVDEIKKCSKLQKKDLGELLLAILHNCTALCFDQNLESIGCSKVDAKFENFSSEIKSCIKDNFDRLSKSQNTQFVDIQEQINKLKTYSDNLLQIPNRDTSPSCNTNLYHKHNHVSVNNTVKAFDESIATFLPAELSNRVNEFLESCNKFEENIENGHSVAMFGHPYHYSGSRHNDEHVEIPAPITEVVELVRQKYPDQEINSCLVNKYCGPNSFLPKHSDNEPSINPESVICTISIGHSATVTFSETHGDKSCEHVAEPNSLYVMSKSSQAYWQHQIKTDSTIPENSVRYSLTFRHVDKKISRSTIIIGDSNTRNLKFGTGKGTFGHNMPGKREEAAHIDDINPAACSGYKNIFIHCGINDIKHHRVNTPEKVGQKFENLRSKIDQILVLCPGAKLSVSPILPTKNQQWNKRAIDFNQRLFDYRNKLQGKFVALNFSEFCDQQGLLRNDMGKFHNTEDPLHLGSKGITALVKIIRQRVLSSSMTVYSYSDVVRGHGVSREGTLHDVAQSGPPRFASAW